MSTGRVIAQVDCNAFYCSCEAVFEPRLWTMPLVVLSNNDGVVIALNTAAKALGIKRGESFFKVSRLIKTAGLQVRSSNYALYGDMSARVMATLKTLSPTVEIYSIDEAFLCLSAIPEASRTEYARHICATVRQFMGIPLSLGIAKTKTLAKAANYFAKQYPQLEGVLDLTGSAQQQEFLQALPVSSVWGIGPRWGQVLADEGVDNALKLRDLSDFWVRKRLGVVGLRTVLELRGMSCLPLEQCPRPRKSVCVSRSFGRPVQQLTELKEAVATFTAKAATKLRREHLATGALTVFVRSNKFKENFFSASANCRLLTASNYTPTLLKHSLALVDKLWRKDVKFAKAGILLTRLTDENTLQLNLFGKWDLSDDRPTKLMRAIDESNLFYQQGRLRFAAEGMQRGWQTRAQYRSNRWTTCWEELPVVRA